MMGFHWYKFWPPTTNMIWRRGGRQTYLTSKAKEFRKLVEHETQWARAMKEMPNVALKGNLQVSLEFCPPDRRRRDLDNLLKSVLDAMTHAGVWLDDSQIRNLCVEMKELDPAKKGKFYICVEELNLEDAA